MRVGVTVEQSWHIVPGGIAVATVELLRALELTRRHARLVMCPSLATMAACEEAGIAAERLRVVPLGVRVHPPQPELSEQVRRRYRLERPFVLFVGTVEPRKNLHRVIEAFRALDAADTELILVGPQGWREDVDVALDGLHGGARTLGYVPRDELDVLYARATAVVYPSLAEGFGLPVLEAMANGAAVVTSAGTATEEVAGDAALLVDPLDVDAIAEALQRLIDDRALAAALGAAARARASTFTWDRSAELAVAVYAEAIEASR